MKDNSQHPAIEHEGPANLQKVKSGRKKKEETSRYLETPMNPYFKVYERLMKYLDSIGLIHGLCFTAELRKNLKMVNKFPDIQWKEPNYGWYYYEEIENLRNNAVLMRRIRKIMFSLKSRCRRIKREMPKTRELHNSYWQLQTLSKWTLNKICDFVIRPGQMVDPECRHQFYTLNVTLLQSIMCKPQKGKNITKDFALKFYQHSLFFSRKFTTFKKKNWIQMKRCSQEMIDQKFLKLFSYFKRNYADILNNYYEWDQYNSDMKRLFDEGENQNDSNQMIKCEQKQ